jgi:uncharacterized protein DUF4136
MVNQVLRTCIAVSAPLLAMSACISSRVTSDVAAPASASQCHTYAWVGSFHYSGGTGRGVVNPLNESRLRSAIAENLASKGVQSASGDADCLVGYGMGVQTIVEGGYPYGPYGWGWGWGWRGAWGWDYPYVFREGIVAVDLYDAKSRRPLWHASVDENVSGLTGAAADERIKAAVAAIFTKYPS